ncbi:MAG: FAD-dependent oxidoreductase [Brachybacterium sp.]|uniref:FAD-dependent oxidoreductase n=1 Tax=Brachybacterium sp. TaxID=1891286 RepID=UPI002649A22F|nr:FAD-dependent oxidoreductase [Brachybacterium sp.]MDN5688440.1 FAD-dependent oxidoreductase [Brachybacterium sp.]
MREAAVVVIGGGPAGLAAAAEAVRTSQDVVLIDAGPRLGGQYWRHGAKDDLPGAPSPRWHHGWSTYRALHDQVHAAIRAGRLRLLASTHVVALDVREDGRLAVQISPTPEAAPALQHLDTVLAESVVLCPGAYDRQLPVPGWTLPGVMAAGGVQAFIKVQEQAPGRRVLLAGTGPFLLAAASSVLQAGGDVAAVCESGDLTGWIPRGASAALVPSKGVEGAQYTALLARHRVPYLPRRAVSRILGDRRVDAAEISRTDAQGTALPGTAQTLEDIDVVGLGWGFVPQAELLLHTGAETRLDVDGSLVGVVDADQASTVPGLFLAGEITGVTGATGAVAEGRIAGRAAAGRVTGRSARSSRRDQRARARHRLFAGAMHHAHPAPTGWVDAVDEATVVCRCEEVTRGEITTARNELAAEDPRSLKGVTRAGMGICQGRICAFAMSCLGSEQADRHQAALSTAKRPLALPLTLGALSEDSDASDASDASEPPEPPD